MSYKILISIERVWVLEHRTDDVLPIDFLKKEIADKYGEGLVEESSSYTELILRFEGDEALAQGYLSGINNLFNTHYSLSADNEILSIAIEKAAAEKAPKESVVEKAPEEKSEPREKKAAKIEKEDSVNKERAPSPEKQTAPSEKKKCFSEIDALIGGAEFKALAAELKCISGQLKKNNTIETFSCQTYIFSINDGCGLTTYLNAFASLLSDLHLYSGDFSKKVVERKIPAFSGEKDDLFGEVVSDYSFSSPSSQILCIDLSEWMDKLNTPAFKNFLTKLERRIPGFIVVFRIPFVDKEVLANVQKHINDVLFVRTISFPPFTNEEIRRFAVAELEKFGFKMSANAWMGFFERISEEKSDGKFYGLKTIKKVVRELLYKKQLDNAQKGKSDAIIRKNDVAALCANGSDLELSGYEMLDKLVGGDAFKERINEIVSQIEFAKSDPNVPSPCIHMRFVGNPGTGKTTLARILGKILKERGVLRIGNFFEYAGRDLCGRYVGETAPKTASICRDAYGSVLFIDEAYSLYRGDDNGRDYGREALETLIAEMENHRSDLVVIMAGYTDEMKLLMKGNAGLESRMPYVIEFPNFTKEQLYDIFVTMLDRRFKYEEDLLPAVKAYFDAIPDEVVASKEFSNARFVRNLFERTWAKASMRCQLEGAKKVIITKNDFKRSTNDKEFAFNVVSKTRIGFVK